MPTFTPPYATYPDEADDWLMTMLDQLHGQTVYSLDGGNTFQTVEYPYIANLASVDPTTSATVGPTNNAAEGVTYFLGGHVYQITPAQAASLTTAGYGAYIFGFADTATAAALTTATPSSTWTSAPSNGVMQTSLSTYNATGGWLSSLLLANAKTLAADLTVTTVRNGTGSNSILAVAVDPNTANSGYALQYQPFQSYLHLYRNNTLVASGQWPVQWISTSTVLRLSYDGQARVRAYFNGQLCLDFTDSAPITTAANTYAGIGVASNATADVWTGVSCALTNP